METLTISPKYQVVIPKDIREKLGLTPGAENPGACLPRPHRTHPDPSDQENAGVSERDRRARRP
jgi:Antidote-toxin recognition MazE, bacterial antitoxin